MIQPQAGSSTTAVGVGRRRYSVEQLQHSGREEFADVNLVSGFFGSTNRSYNSLASIGLTADRFVSRLCHRGKRPRTYERSATGQNADDCKVPTARSKPLDRRSSRPRLPRTRRKSRPVFQGGNSLSEQPRKLSRLGYRASDLVNQRRRRTAELGGTALIRVRKDQHGSIASIRRPDQADYRQRKSTSQSAYAKSYVATEAAVGGISILATTARRLLQSHRGLRDTMKPSRASRSISKPRFRPRQKKI